MESLDLAPTDCSICLSLCCRGNTVIELSKKEFKQLSEAGTELFHITRAGLRKARYYMKTDCGNLATNSETNETYCADYENRPKACSEFTVASNGCIQMQKLRREKYAPVDLGSTIPIR